jgi:hypothetical protein
MKITDVILQEDTDYEKYIRQNLAAMAKDAHKKDYWGVNEILSHVLNYKGDPDQEIMRQSQNLDLLNTYKAAIIKSLLIVIKMPEDEFEEYEYDFNNVINFLKSNLKWPEIDVITKAIAYNNEKKSVNESEESDELVAEFLGYIDQKNYWEAFNSLIGAYDTDRDCLQSWWASFDDEKPAIMKGLLYVIKNESDLPLESIIADMYADLKWPELLTVQKAMMYNKQQKAVGEAYDPDADPMIDYVQTMYDDLVGGSTELTVLNLRDYIYDTGSAENLARAIQEIKPELVNLIQKNKHGMIKSMLEIIKKDFEYAVKAVLPVLEVLHHLGIDWPESDRIAAALTQGKPNKQANESELTETLKTDGYGGWISPTGKVDYVGEHEHEEWMEDNHGLSYDQAFEQNWVRFATQDTNDLYLQGTLSALKKVYSRYAGNIARTQSIFVDINPARLGPQYKETWDAFHFWSNPKDKSRFMKMFGPETVSAMAESDRIADALSHGTQQESVTENDYRFSDVHQKKAEEDADRMNDSLEELGKHIAAGGKITVREITSFWDVIYDINVFSKYRLAVLQPVLEHHKKTIVYMMLYILKHHHDDINEPMPEIFTSLRHARINWPELKTIQQALAQGSKTQSVTDNFTESEQTPLDSLFYNASRLLDKNINYVGNVVIALRNDDRINEPEFLPKTIELFGKYKPQIIKYILNDIAKDDNHSYSNVQWLIPRMKKLGIKWPEFKIIQKGITYGKKKSVSEAFGSAMTLQALRTRMNKLMNDDQKYTDPTQRTNWQDGVWRFINSNQAAIFADKGNTGNGDYPAAPYAAWLLVQHMDAHPERQREFYMKLRKAFRNHPKIQFLKDRYEVNKWILQNANNEEYFINNKPLPNPTVNVRNPAMFKDAGIKATSREQALKNAEAAGNKLLVAAVNATNAQTQPSYTQQTESVEEADDHGKFKTISDMISRDYAEHPVRGFYMMLYHLNELELTVADMPEIKPLIDRVKPDVIRALLQSVKADNDGMNISNALQILDRMQKCGVNWPEIDKIRQGLQHNRQQTTEGIDEIESDRLKSFLKQIQQPLASKTGWLAAQTLEDLAGVAISKSYSDDRFTDQDYAEAAAVLNLNNHKDVLIKGILENIKQNIANGNSTTWLAENVAMQKQILSKLGCNWPEMDRIAAAVAHNAN